MREGAGKMITSFSGRELPYIYIFFSKYTVFVYSTAEIKVFNWKRKEAFVLYKYLGRAKHRFCLVPQFAPTGDDLITCRGSGIYLKREEAFILHKCLLSVGADQHFGWTHGCCFFFLHKSKSPVTFIYSSSQSQRASHAYS